MKSKIGKKSGALATSAAVVLGGLFCVAGQPTSTQASPGTSPTSPSLEQDCLAAGLELPLLAEAKLWFPGSSPENQKVPGRFQTANITPEAFEAMPSECRGIYDRKVYVRVGIQIPTKRSKYFTITRPKWEYVNGNEDNDNGKGLGYTESVQPSNGLPKIYYFKPTPGPRVTHVQGRYKNTVTETASGTIVGTKLGPKFSVKVVAPRRAQ